MIWTILILGCFGAAGYAYTKGQNPVAWGLSSLPGVAILSMMKGTKGQRLGESRRANKEVGTKVGLMTSAATTGGVIALSLLNVI